MKLKARLIFQNICVLSGTLLITVCLSLLFVSVYSDISDEKVHLAADTYGAVIENSIVIANNSPLSEVQIKSAVISAETGSVIYKSGEMSYTIGITENNASGRHLIFLTLTPVANYKNFYTTLAAFILVVFIITFLAASFIALQYNTKNIIEPVVNLKNTTDMLARGELNSPVASDGTGEINSLCNSVEKLRVKLKESLYYNEKSDENRKFLISGISHDLRTPITAASGYIEGVLDNVADTEEKRRRYLQKALLRLGQINSIISDLLLYSKLDAGQLPFEFHSTDIVSYMRDITEDFAFGANGTFSFESDFDKRAVSLDAERFRRVIQNIIDNARKHSDGNIAISLRENTSSVIIEIADSGGGVPADELPHIFEKFYRGDASRKSEGSSGLGLAIAKLVVESHGGQIWGVNNTSGGLSIIISLKKVTV